MNNKQVIKEIIDKDKVVEVATLPPKLEYLKGKKYSELTPKEKSLINLNSPWQKGKSGNPNGRPKGRRDFKTDFEIACREVAKSLKLKKSPDAVSIALLQTGIKAGMRGKHAFWQEITNRVYGKVEERVDVSLTSLNELEISMRKLAGGEAQPLLETPLDQPLLAPVKDVKELAGPDGLEAPEASEASEDNEEDNKEGDDNDGSPIEDGDE